MNRLILFLMCFTTGPAALGLTLEDALQRSRLNAPELAQPDHLRKQALAQAKAVNGAYDPTVFGEYQYADDRTQAVNTFAGDERRRRSAEIGARKLFTTGTSVEMKLLHEMNETIFPSSSTQSNPSPTAGTSTSPGTAGASGAAQQQAGFGAGAVNYNPAYETKGEVTIQQELWRNFAAREIKLKQQIATGAAVAPTFEKITQEQQVQAEAEQLYWLAASLKQQLELGKQLVTKSQEFTRQMGRRVGIGRADAVDEADAEANLVSQETSLLEIEINLQKTLRQLALRVDPTGATVLTPTDIATPLAGGPRNNVPPLPKALASAEERRADLQMLVAQAKVAGTKRALAEEEGEPSLAVYASGSQNGIAEERSESFEEVGKARHPSYALGVKFEMPIGNTKSASEVVAAVEEAAALAAQKSVIMLSLRQNLQAAYEDWQGSRRKLAQAERKIDTFERKRRQENIKLQQARSERVTVIRYEMEVLTAKNEKIMAQKQMRDAEAQIRMLIHGYPSAL